MGATSTDLTSSGKPARTSPETATNAPRSRDRDTTTARFRRGPSNSASHRATRGRTPSPSPSLAGARSGVEFDLRWFDLRTAADETFALDLVDFDTLPVGSDATAAAVSADD
ncbi:hypothetical protein MBEHAL_0526 [Halarchaeum acidiphilum MH1-52-1]|uniref:Uncharacterized protein n=1 Tax=Halarchaeum acidiphilum MH1-52-1 TaxID=1261545 RepID=U2YDK8_9EURY|nr:hypothetical protein MBEHAL_0526 [Halarchaeum acidiphilum MH1-52-1]